MGDTSLAYEVWNKSAAASSEVLNNVIDIIKPRLVVFVSVSAGKAYKDLNAPKPAVGTDIVYTSHPASPFSWNKPLKSLGFKTGKQVFEESLECSFK